MEVDYERFFLGASDLLCVIAEDGSFLKTNPAFSEILEWPSSGCPGRKLWDLVHPGDRERIVQAFGHASGLAPFPLEARLLGRFGLYKWFSWRIYPVHSEGLRYLVLHDMTREKGMADELRGLTLHDDLTGLCNRRGFFVFGEHMLNLAPREGKTLMVMYVDIKGMKAVNARYGHPEGDRLLVLASGVLQKTFRKTDVLSRLGADDFAILALLNHGEDRHSLEARLRNAWTSASAGDPGNRDTGLLIGIALSSPNDPLPLEVLLSSAEKDAQGKSLCV